MFYFIPSWYQQERKWYDDTRYWFRVFDKMEFDDTVHQIKLFQDSGEVTALLLLAYHPNLRYFLHGQDLLGTYYWSFFDDIQNISRTQQENIDFKALQWPAGTRFVYSPFAVLALSQGQVLAQIQFAENGNLLTIEFQKEGKSDKTYVFDDRGFLSSILYYDDQGQADYQDYLNEFGVWQVRESLTQQILTINPQSDKPFLATTYPDWESLMAERLSRLAEDALDDEDSLILAANSQHNSLFIDQFPRQEKVFSFFADRYNLAQEADFANLAEQAACLVVDKEDTQEIIGRRLAERGQGDLPVLKISPFDTRLRLGKSATLKELEIYFHLHELDEDVFWTALRAILRVMEHHPHTILRLVTFDREYPVAAREEAILQLILEEYDASYFLEEAEDLGENQLDETHEWVLSRISLEIFTNEGDVIAALDRARLVVDVGEIPDLYTQIASISAGLPQINLRASDYVEHQKNGWILDELEDLPQALDYYLTGLRNWNQALVATVDKMADYTSGQLVHRWKQVLKRKRTDDTDHTDRTAKLGR